MKQIFILLLSVFSVSCSAQDQVDPKNNGLIYSDHIVKQLKFIVDSLNLKFKTCDLNKAYRSKSQVIGHYVSLSGARVKEARNDIEKKISFDDFIRKYPSAKVDKELLIVKFKYKDYRNAEVLAFNSIALNNKGGYEITFKDNLANYEKLSRHSWALNFQPADEYDAASVKAFFFTTDFREDVLPLTYAKMLQYSECMVDTSTQIFYQKAIKTGVRFSNKRSKKIEELESYVSKKTFMPIYHKGDDEEAFYQKLEKWNKEKYSITNVLYKEDPHFVTLLNESLAEALKDSVSDDELEELVGLYLNKKTALELKRNRIVIGGCSMDDSPRIHAMKIAKLSAETANWEVFLRAHLDIMNDRFDRVSDGSYAQQGRKTYIKELEVLGINVLDLLLGISLRTENATNNHYYGNIGRLGRALAETKDRTLIEDKMLDMITDSKLDDYNRILIYYLFLNYNYNLSDKNIQTANVTRLNTAVKTLPGYLSGKLAVVEKSK